MGKTVLEMKNIHKKFPGVYALNSVDFELKAGEVHALLGENGAGKSTLIKVLGGIYHPDQGQIIIDGKEVKINTVMDADAAGVSIIHQEIMTVPEMTIAENIFLGREPKTKFGTVDFKKMLSVSQELIDGFGLEMKASRKILALSIAQQQMVAIVKAISINAKIVVMDEPTSSLTDSEVDYLFEIIEKLKAQGIGIVYISHKLDELFRICDRITVMRDGQYVGTKVTAETTRDELISMMVGRTLDNYYVRTFHELGDVVLEAKNVKGGLVKDASFQLRKGEILGFAGLVGSGRSELMKDMIGLDPREGGEVFVDGKKVEFHGVTDAQREGLVLVPENRKKEGLLLKNSVGFNLTLAVLGDFIKGISVKKSKETEIINTYVDAMAIKTPSVNQLVGNLSGGNQQKVLIGKWLAAAPKILIMDEPTRGVDVGAKAEIYQIMNNLADQGVSIIMISSELPEVLGMCDRICVMYEGEITGVVDRKDFSQERVMHFATGGR
ncbi:sugar ABC transporter ATP-binding protein [Zongyangia hominis]